MPATDYRRWPSPRRMVSFSLCAGRWRSSKFVKKLPVGVPKPVWHLPHSTTLLFFWFHEKNVQKKKVFELITVESKLLLSKKFVDCLSQNSAEWQSLLGGARAHHNYYHKLRSTEKKAGTTSTAKRAKAVYLRMPGDEFFCSWSGSTEKASFAD